MAARIPANGPQVARRPTVPLGVTSASLDPVESAACPAPSASHDTGPFRVGERVGTSYRVLRPLGSGGFATVYEAEDIALGRKIALKTSSLPDAELRAEAQALAAFHHPSVVGVYGFGEHRGYPFIAMELIHGRTLHEHLDLLERQGRIMPLLECINLTLPLAEVLAIIHAHGLVHRDVKPGNVMLAPGDRVVLMDFGLFLPKTIAQSELSGTPEYMAPETVEGAATCPSIDVYGLGATMYEMLTLQPPFSHPDSAVTMTMQVREEVPSLRNLRPDVPYKLAELVSEMLSKDPTARPDAASVAFRLRSCRDDLVRRARNPAFRVLVVDDDAGVNRLLQVWIAKHLPGATVECTDNAEDALVRIRQQPPDVLLLDLNMPRTSGVELVMVLRGMQLARDCMIVSVSAAAQPPDVELLRSLGITRFVSKGATMLHEVLMHVIAQWENIERLRMQA